VIDAQMGRIYGDPHLLADGRVERAVQFYSEWVCECGITCKSFEYRNMAMQYRCKCGRRYEVDWAHGIEPRVSELS
jgi:hypothetical protein